MLSSKDGCSLNASGIIIRYYCNQKIKQSALSFIIIVSDGARVLESKVTFVVVESIHREL